MAIVPAGCTPVMSGLVPQVPNGCQVTRPTHSEQPLAAVGRSPFATLIVCQRPDAAASRPRSPPALASNRHSARCDSTAPPPATSCLGASPTPAYSARGWLSATGVRETCTFAALLRMPPTQLSWVSIAAETGREQQACGEPAARRRGSVPVTKRQCSGRARADRRGHG